MYFDFKGDGDQSAILTEVNAQFHRYLFSCGENTDYCLKHNLFPNFNLYVMSGNVERCYYILNSCRTKEEKQQLLETRYGIQRFSALFFAFLGQRICEPKEEADYIGCCYYCYLIIALIVAIITAFVVFLLLIIMIIICIAVHCHY